MKLPAIILGLTLTASFCSTLRKDGKEFEFGPIYNDTRQKFGSPLIKSDMDAKRCCGEWTVYEILGVPSNNNPYHSSKTIRTIHNGKLTGEKDIYRKSIDDTTLLQVNLLSQWKWEEQKIVFTGSMGKIDKRTLNLSAKDFLVENSKYPDYEWTDLDLAAFDSVLQSWGLSRKDSY